MAFSNLWSFFFLSISVCVYGRPANEMTESEFTNLVFTVEKFDQILKAYSAYKQFMPDYVWEPIEKITDEQKTQAVQMVNDYHAGQFEPKNYNDMIAILKKSYPALAGPYETMYNKYKDQVAKLGPKGQEYCNGLEAQMYADASPDRVIWACHIFNNAKSAVSGAKALLLDDSEAAKIEEAFPEAVSFLNSKEFDAYAIVVNNLKTLDCDKDREQVFNTIKLFDKHSVLTSNT
uniref:Sel1 repeat family protein n=2 Tax=Caenorhabditis tropicalis TaxID=1561998 RepID=A0A1I7UJQ5_9PELO